MTFFYYRGCFKVPLLEERRPDSSAVKPTHCKGMTHVITEKCEKKYNNYCTVLCLTSKVLKFSFKSLAEKLCFFSNIWMLPNIYSLIIYLPLILYCQGALGLDLYLPKRTESVVQTGPSW